MAPPSYDGPFSALTLGFPLKLLVLAGVQREPPTPCTRSFHWGTGEAMGRLQRRKYLRHFALLSKCGGGGGGEGFSVDESDILKTGA